MGNQQSGAGGGAGKVKITKKSQKPKVEKVGLGISWEGKCHQKSKFIKCKTDDKMIISAQDKGENKEKKKYEPPVPTRSYNRTQLIRITVG